MSCLSPLTSYMIGKTSIMYILIFYIRFLQTRDSVTKGKGYTKQMTIFHVHRPSVNVFINTIHITLHCKTEKQSSMSVHCMLPYNYDEWLGKPLSIMHEGLFCWLLHNRIMDRRGTCCHAEILWPYCLVRWQSQTREGETEPWLTNQYFNCLPCITWICSGGYKPYINVVWFIDQ